MKFASRISRISPSATLKMTALAAELKHQNKPVFNMSVGEPDFSTPQNIQDAAIKAMHNNHTKYTPGSGTLELKQAILQKIERDNQLFYDTKNVIVSCGGKHSLYNACQVLFEQGDEVIIFSPYWVSFPDFVSVTGAKPIFVQTIASKQYEPDFNDLKQKISNNTKGIIINSPSNPTGGVWSKDAICKTLEICKKHNLWIFSDECYEKFVYNGAYQSLAALNDNPKILTFQSCSKAYAMTGWRIGYTIGDAAVVSAMSKLQGQSTSCPNSIAQFAAIEALIGPQDSVDKMSTIFLKRRDLILSELASIEHVTCDIPQGAFYVFPDFSYFIGMHDNEGNKITNISDLCLYILDKTGVVTVSGDSFGAPNNIRLSYATSEKIIIEATSLIKKVLSKLHF